jgi:polar amino acid transport system ATP-binding protein
MSLVEIDAVDKSFGPLQVLDGVSLAVAESEIVAIIGRSGSGKSTLLRCINGLEPIQGGTIRVDGDLVTAPKADLRQLRQKVGIVFQSYNLFPHLTVERNITLAPTVVKRMELAEAQTVALDELRRVGLED